MQSSPSSCYLLHLRFRYSPQRLVPIHPQSMFPPWCERPSFVYGLLTAPPECESNLWEAALIVWSGWFCRWCRAPESRFLSPEPLASRCGRNHEGSSIAGDVADAMRGVWCPARNWICLEGAQLPSSRPPHRAWRWTESFLQSARDHVPVRQQFPRCVEQAFRDGSSNS